MAGPMANNAAADPNSSYVWPRTEMLKFIDSSAHRILDIGCGPGEFGMHLKKGREAEVWGIEIEEAAARVARQRLDKVLCGDVSLLLRELPDAYFQCIVFNDVLEHLIDPWRLLREIKPKLDPSGTVVCSIPNIRYYETLKDLVLKKEWRYADFGILDRTHLRFFTYGSILEMFRAADYSLLRIEGINPIRSRRFEYLNRILLGFLDDCRYLQFACVARPLPRTDK